MTGQNGAREWGAQRRTHSFDAVVDFHGVNLARVAAALNATRVRLRVEGVSDDEARRIAAPVQADALSSMEISTWQTDLGAVDVLSRLPNLEGARLDYETLVVADRANAFESAASCSASPSSK